MTVVALHSLFFDGSMFDDLASRSGRRTVAPDHRGQASRALAYGSRDLDALADDAVATIRRIGAPVHLVGSSMGAYVAMIVCARHPELARSVVLSAATADAETRPERFVALVEDLRRDGPAPHLDRIAETMFGAHFLETGGAELGRWRDAFASRVDVADAAAAVFARRALWEEVEAIRCPVRLLAGAGDRAKSPADMTAIATRIGCQAPVVFERSGHTPFVEEPEAVAAALVPWWDQIDTERRDDDARSDR